MRKSVRGVLAILLTVGSANVAMAQGAAKLHTTPNSVKYKSTGAKPATGRAGSATLEARVLVAKDATMLIEAGTAGVEAAANPGTITKMQVKIGADFTQNHNGLNGGGFWSRTMPAAVRATPVQLQANIKGIDPKRNDVVTVTPLALLRPDIAVESVSGTPQQAPNTPVTFIAAVREKNGDVGATTDCVLSVNGTVVDTASAIFVDAGGAVSCQFAHSFAAPGDYTVDVAATSVKPGDWDLSNNTATTTIRIVNPESKIGYGQMQAYQESVSNDYAHTRTGGSYCQNDYYYYCNYSRELFERRMLSTIDFWGYNYGVNSALLTQLDVKVRTNGVLSDAVSLTPINGYAHDDGNYYYNCADYYQQSYDAGNNRYYYGGYQFQMCSNGYRNTADQWANYYLYRRSGDVTYISRETCDNYGYNYGYCGYYWNNYSSGETHGNGQSLGWTGGTQVGLQLTFHDANGGKHTADRSVTIATQNEYAYSDGPYTSYDEWNGYYYYSNRYSYFYGYGYTTWNPWSDGQ